MNQKNVEQSEMDEENVQPNARRDFLKQGATATGAVLSLSVLGGLSRAEAATAGDGAPKATASVAAAPASLQLSLKEHKALGKIGGFEIIPIANDTLIVARTEADSFVACSAICTHKGCKVAYEHATREFVCPCHGARFASDGRVLKGPAKAPLKNYATDVAAVVSLSAVSATSSTPPKKTS